jgi:hypothetical protein
VSSTGAASVARVDSCSASARSRRGAGWGTFSGVARQDEPRGKVGKVTLKVGLVVGQEKVGCQAQVDLEQAMSRRGRTRA